MRDIPDLTGAEIDMLRGLPQRLGAQSRDRAGKREQAEMRRREQLQRAGLLSIKADEDGVFLVMITEKGVAALGACRPGGRG